VSSVLIVEDDDNLRLTLHDNLEREGHAVKSVATVADTWRALEAGAFEVVVLDLMLPDGDGYAVCKRLREQRLPVRVLMLTARSLEEDLVRGFDAGADDYVAKPYRLKELLARVSALARRTTAERQSSKVHRFGPFTLKVQTRTVTSDAGPIELTRKEFDLLLLLLESGGRVLTRDEILDAVWGDVVVDLHTVDNFVSNLKKKLKVKKGKAGFELKTVRGVGFRWVC
jgi:DNA-binding response OmpR family regulator